MLVCHFFITNLKYTSAGMVLIIFILNLNQRCKTSVFICHSHIFFSSIDTKQFIKHTYIVEASAEKKRTRDNVSLPGTELLGLYHGARQAGVPILVSPLFGARTFACWARGLFPCSLSWGTSPIICRYGRMGNDSETLWGVILGMACQI